MEDDEIIVFDNVSKAYQGNVQALNDINIRIKKGEFVFVVGDSGSGKSTFINAYAKKACTKTGNKPGVTKGKQWIRLSKTLELLDTPGILWPKFESQIVGEHLALIGSINDDIIDTVELSCALLDFLVESYPNLLKQRFVLIQKLN